ncbi:MAG: tyrosine-protein phosphatase [Oscillospiraceae bacterium]|nr:tyrosine-protein phosphatase [Oscillospiraceae bacterium]
MLRYNWDNTFNARDLGYTPAVNGKYIKPLRFIRSDAPHSISDSVKDFLIKNDITTIIDLRNEKIANTSPNAFVSDNRFSCCNYPLSVNAKAPDSENDVIENYCRMIENDTAIVNIFRTMANSAGGVLFHCQEGKDRTGIISALLLLLAGVSDFDIYADYEISNVYLYEMIKKAKAVLPDHLLYVKPEYMENVLIYLREKYKTVENYLQSKGVSETEIYKLKSKLLDQTNAGYDFFVG